MYHGAYILLSKGKATIYRSGKYIIYGLKSLDDVERSYREFLTLLSPIIDPTLVSPPRVQNIVGMDDVGMEIPLTKLVVALQMEHVEYEPEQFPGVIYRGEGGTALIFSSGKMIFPGFKDIHSMEVCASELKEKIRSITWSLKDTHTRSFVVSVQPSSPGESTCGPEHLVEEAGIPPARSAHPSISTRRSEGDTTRKTACFILLYQTPRDWKNKNPEVQNCMPY